MAQQPNVTPARGLDGLTADELATSRRGWWDDAFTELLLRRVPHGATKLVDVGCGLAAAAHAILPKLSAATYIGIDADEQRLREAAKLLEGTPYGARVELRSGRAESLPCRDAEADFVLTSMTLQHVTDVAAAVRDIGRVLVPKGRFVAVEPDNLNNIFYFDGVLENVNAAFRDLFAELRRERRPADIAIGPAVASLVERAGLSVVEFFPYVVGPVRRQTAKQFFDAARQVVRIVAASLPSGSTAVEACNTEIDRAESKVGPSVTGYPCHFVPVFVCVADKA